MQVGILPSHTASPRIDDALREDILHQIGAFTSSGVSIDKIAFETIQGKECVRVCIHNRMESAHFYDVGYSPQAYGYIGLRELNEAIRLILHDGARLSQQRRKSEIGSIFDYGD
jgi:hypothetical protein